MDNCVKPSAGFAGRQLQVETCQAISGLFMLNKQALQEFKRIWKEERGEEVSDKLAMEEATQLLTLFDAIYKPIKKAWLEEYLRDHPEELNEYEQRREDNI